MRPSKQRLGVITVLALVGLCLGTALALAQTTATPKTNKCPESIQGQQLCPPATKPEKTLCSVSIDCPTIQTPERVTCQPGADCPPGKPAAKPDKKKK
jgi:hypothetical protein